MCPAAKVTLILIDILIDMRQSLQQHHPVTTGSSRDIKVPQCDRRTGSTSCQEFRIRFLGFIQINLFQILPTLMMKTENLQAFT